MNAHSGVVVGRRRGTQQLPLLPSVPYPVLCNLHHYPYFNKLFYKHKRQGLAGRGSYTLRRQRPARAPSKLQGRLAIAPG